MMLFRNSSSSGRRRHSRGSNGGGGIGSIAKLDSSIYFAPSAAVRSTRLAELNVRMIVSVSDKQCKNNNNLEEEEGMELNHCRLNDPEMTNSDEIKELSEICLRIAEKSADDHHSTVLVHGRDIGCVAMVCIAYLIKCGGMAEDDLDGVVGFVQAKRTDVCLTAAGTGFRRLLLQEFQNSVRRNKAGSRAVRLLNRLRKLLQNWFFLSLAFIVVGAAVKFVMSRYSSVNAVK